jgi:hypothetical protein
VMALGQVTDLGGFNGIRRRAGVAKFGHKNSSHRPPLKTTFIEEYNISA